MTPRLPWLLLLAAALCACPTPEVVPPETRTFSIGGTVTGLAGTLVVVNNGSDEVSVERDGPFVFPTKLASGTTYDVTLKSAPASQECAIEGGRGSVGAADVQSVRIACKSPAFTVGGTVTGLSGTLVLDNKGDELTIATSGPFTFKKPLATGATYDVTVTKRPAGQTCTIAQGTGTVGRENVTAVSVDCKTDSFTVGGTVTGLIGSVVLQNNGKDDLTVTAAGPFVFATHIAHGAAFEVTLKAQPRGGSCTVSGGKGTVDGANVVDVSVTCKPELYKVGGTVSGLSGSLILQNNGEGDLVVKANGPFVFATPIPHGSSYFVSGKLGSFGQRCMIANYKGVVNAADVTNVAIVCTSQKYTVGGVVTGLLGSLVLQNDGADDLALAANGLFSFGAPVSHGSTYNVTVKQQPVGLLCNVTNGAGTITGANVVKVVVACTRPGHTVGGTVSGLSGTLVLTNNGTNDLTVAASGPFSFSSPVAYGAAYSVSLKQLPAGQVCTVLYGKGFVTGPVTNVQVNCRSATFAVGGFVTGLRGTIVVQNNGADDLALTDDDVFSFDTPVSSGAAYNVTIKQQPSGQTCTVRNGKGTVAGRAVTNVALSCGGGTFTVGGTVSGLKGKVVLQNNGIDDLAVTLTGTPFTFSIGLAAGDSYRVSVKQHPLGQTCAVANGSGAIGGANVSDVQVTCQAEKYSVGGTAIGLSGTMTLQNNGGDDLVASVGAFTFKTELLHGAAFDVTIKQPGTGQLCSTAGGKGTVNGANVTSVAVFCQPLSFTVGGTVGGLTGTLVLLNNGGDDLTIAKSGAFSFSTPVQHAARYGVTVKDQPAGQTCGVGGSTGTVNGANVTTVTVTCRSQGFTVGGAVKGLEGTLVLANNGGDDLSLASDGAFVFGTPVLHGEAYSVTVKQQPLGQACAVANGAGTVNGASVIDVAVTCVDKTFTIGGTVSGLSGTLVLTNNGADDLSIVKTGPFAFTTPVARGGTYSVAVKQAPANQTCTIASAKGLVGGANVTSVAVSCNTKTYKIGGSATGLAGSLVLLNNGADPVTVAADGAFAFSTPAPSGSAYAVTVKTAPPGQTCSVSGGSGAVGAADVTSVLVTCVSPTFTVGGTVGGLTGSVALQNNGTDTLARSANGAFTFATPLRAGATYRVTVSAQPSGQTCTVTGGTGTMASANVTSVTVDCKASASGARLLISEVGSTFFPTPKRDNSPWIEVANVSQSPVSLADYELRTRYTDRAVDPLTLAQGSYDFDLPAATVPAGGYAILRAKVNIDLFDGPTVFYLSAGAGAVAKFPAWNANGFVELIHRSTQKTEDFVRFGTSTATPQTSSEWSGASAPALPFKDGELGKSLTRSLALADSNSAADWTLRSFATFAGKNDVTCETDADADGIPDCAEVSGATFAGLPLYDWGARPNQKDLFMEIDWMDPNAKGFLDEGMLPRREAFDKVKQAFLVRGFYLHFDVGDLFDKSPGIDTANHDLGGGSQVAFACRLTVTKGAKNPPIPDLSTVAEYKAKNMDPARKQIFWYLLFGNTMDDVSVADCKTKGNSSGQAELPGNDFIITMGNWKLNSSSPEQTNNLINKQASTLMHELGHTLNLGHGGFEGTNYKPNYVSIMNYMYQTTGLPSIGDASEGDRYYFAYSKCGVYGGIDSPRKLKDGPYDSPSNLRMDYSDGTSADLETNNLDEARGLGRSGSKPVDFDEDGSIDSGVTAYVHRRHTDRDNGCPTDAMEAPERLKDHNDWANLTLFGRRNEKGDRNGSPIDNDTQPTIVEDAPRPGDLENP